MATIDNSPGRYAQILYDDIFKLIFSAPENRDLLIMMLNLLLPGIGVKEITFLDKEQHGFAIDEKKYIFDVYRMTQRDERAVVEMQYSSEDDFLDRTLFYATCPLQEQLVTRMRDRIRNRVRWARRGEEGDALSAEAGVSAEHRQLLPEA